VAAAGAGRVDPQSINITDHIGMRASANEPPGSGRASAESGASSNLVGQGATGGKPSTLRVRHWTTKEGLAGIRTGGSINPARAYWGDGTGIGVHFELGPDFGPAKTAKDELGLPYRDSYSYVEFDAPPGWERTYVGTRQSGMIETGLTPLNLDGLNPTYKSVPWWAAELGW